ncbi:MAG: CoB--CoM heterodisulfide reductase iron-sulfur subunit B family protein [Desulfovibrionaceae bacterium]|nr:CoB--CoM heterodisulfide reductase iron-sulfur subunit B family protein [Desulfovibrionaceae bacterium]
MSIVYYPGCSAAGTSSDYEKSTQAVCDALGMSFTPLPDWNCCGSTPAHATSTELSAALSVRNLDIAAKMGAEKVATPCPSCLSNLRLAKKRMEKPEFRARVDELLDEASSAELPQTYSVMQLIYEKYGSEFVAHRVQRPLKGLKVACYYGCLMSRPADIMADFGHPENPQVMESLLRACGAEVVEFPLKTECCGASHGIPERQLTANLSGKILETAQNMGIDALVAACPLCQMNLDLRQKQAGKAMGKEFALPVFYYTQMMGMAFGIKLSALGLNKLVVSPEPVLKKWQAALKEGVCE